MNGTPISNPNQGTTYSQAQFYVVWGVEDKGFATLVDEETYAAVVAGEPVRYHVELRHYGSIEAPEDFQLVSVDLDNILDERTDAA